MKDYIKERIKKEYAYVIATKATVRKTAQKFGVSKSTVYVDLTSRLAEISLEQWSEVKKILRKNKEQWHLRGGIATKRKYARLKRGYEDD